MDYKFNIFINKIRYTIYSSIEFGNCLVFKSKDKDPLIEFYKFYNLDLSKSIQKQISQLVKKSIKLKNFK